MRKNFVAFTVKYDMKVCRRISIGRVLDTRGAGSNPEYIIGIMCRVYSSPIGRALVLTERLRVRVPPATSITW